MRHKHSFLLFLFFSLVPVFLIFLFASPGYAERGVKITGAVNTERRIALVIGNSAYKSSPLRNPVNDAQDMTEALRGLGFDVIHRKNANKRTMVSAINEFGRKLRSADVGLFYYAGHGMQVNGRNYLIPVGSQVESESDVEFESVDAGRLLGKMEDAESKINIVILDACRNNPFARSFRSGNRGLAIMTAPTGSFVVFATAPGSVAADGDGRNGIFTQHLLKHIKTPDLKIEEVLKRTRNGVLQDTDKKQTPWQSSSLTGDFYFVPGTKASSVGSGSEAIEDVKKTQKPIQKIDPETELWQIVKDSNDANDFVMFLEEFPNGRFKTHAKLKLSKLKKKELIDCCYLTVRSNVSGDMVYIDGVAKRGTSRQPFKLSAGTYQVEVKKQGYDTYAETISISNDKPKITLSARLMEEEKERIRKEQEQMKMASLTQDMGKALGGTRSSDGRYVDNGDGTITDTRTNLMWTKKDSYADLGKCLDWNDSKRYVSRLNTGGYSDWRLPRVQELKAIYEESKKLMAYDNDSSTPLPLDTIFAEGGAYGYWSSETTRSSSARVFTFLYGGSVDEYARGYCLNEGVRAVRR